MTTKKSLHVLVYGATGSQASPVVWKLLEKGHRPYVFTRHPEKASAMQAAGAVVVEGDMTDAARLREASKGMDAVALLVPFFNSDPGTTGRNAIDAAKDAGVPLLVYNTSGLTPPAKTGNPTIDIRIDLTNYLQASGIPAIILQPTVYMENWFGPYTAPYVAGQNQVAYPNPPDMRVGWIASEDVGAFVAEAIERPELAGSSFVLSGPENLTGIALADQFSLGLGRPVRYYAMPPQEFGDILGGIFGPEGGAAVASEYQKLWDNPTRPVMYADMEPVLATLPVRLTTVREWVAKHASAFSQ
ncbi:SDR family oxidoreductase [Spirosoma linguale]|uniref:NmrA family protein n=1 Tax=Spirosoma linguale (strain ATCC 33905 / DSM 74 / LMG 10896 / Claus 1) TaxID=504472 RepID=D2QBG5_SPILD|nr:NmrA family protein [Spirosoma linguale DSM 74]